MENTTASNIKVIANKFLMCISTEVIVAIDDISSISTDYRGGSSIHLKTDNRVVNFYKCTATDIANVLESASM